MNKKWFLTEISEQEEAYLRGFETGRKILALRQTAQRVNYLSFVKVIGILIGVIAPSILGVMYLPEHLIWIPTVYAIAILAIWFLVSDPVGEDKKMRELTEKFTQIYRTEVLFDHLGSILRKMAAE
jgi:hypothetical protein